MVAMAVRPDLVLVFFFQAEDGIRCSSVTGVEPCALPFLRINRTGKVRPVGESGFRWLSSVVPQVGTMWSGAVDCFAEATCRLPCTLLSRWDEPYTEAWLIVTDCAP